jgi:hypothetical protein
LGKFYRVFQWKLFVYLWPFGLSYGRLAYFGAIYVVYFMVIWYIFPVLVCCTKKNLATLIQRSVLNIKFSYGSSKSPTYACFLAG